MSTPPKPSKKPPHAWILYVATLAPLFAIVFAFSLGPSPAKHIQSLRHASVDEAHKILDNLDDLSLPYLVDEVLRPEAAHRTLIIHRLSELKDPLVNYVLDQLSEDARLPLGIRNEAVAALAARRRAYN